MDAAKRRRASERAARVGLEIVLISGAESASLLEGRSTDRAR